MLNAADFAPPTMSIPPSHLETPDRPSPRHPYLDDSHPSYRSPRHILPQNLIHRSLRITRIGLKPFQHLQINLQPASNLTRRDPERRILKKRFSQRRNIRTIDRPIHWVLHGLRIHLRDIAQNILVHTMWLFLQR
jgi:hypothetical protein